MCICILAVATIVVDDDDDDKWTEFYIFFCILLLLLYFKLAQATHPSSSFMACHRHVIKLPSSTTTSPHHPCHCSPLANICNCLCQSVLFVCLSVCLSLCVCLCVCFTFGLWMYARLCLSPICNISLGAIFSTWIALHSNDMAVPAGRPLQRECIAPPLPWFKQTFWRCDDHSVFIFVFYWADGSLQRVVCRRDEHFWHYFRPCRLHRAQCHRMLCALTSSGEMNFYALWDEWKRDDPGLIKIFCKRQMFQTSFVPQRPLWPRPRLREISHSEDDRIFSIVRWNIKFFVRSNQKSLCGHVATIII